MVVNGVKFIKFQQLDLIMGFPRNLGVVVGETRVFQKKDMGRGEKHG